MTDLSSRLDEAFAYARKVHQHQTRKGTEAPYLGHLMGVASIVLDDGGNEDEAIAGLLHDAAEDHGGRERLEDIRRRFGDAVARIVEDCTDSWDTPKAPWAERKRAYIEHARRLPASSLRVSAADKVHNSYAILRDLRERRRKGVGPIQRAGRRRGGVLRGARPRVSRSRRRAPGRRARSNRSWHPAGDGY